MTILKKMSKKESSKMLSRNPYSAIHMDNNNKKHLRCPRGISMRNWKRGLKNRWGENPTEIEFPCEKNNGQRLADWIENQNIEYCRHPFINNRYIVPGVSIAAIIKMQWSIDNE